MTPLQLCLAKVPDVPEHGYRGGVCMLPKHVGEHGNVSWATTGDGTLPSRREWVRP